MVCKRDPTERPAISGSINSLRSQCLKQSLLFTLMPIAAYLPYLLVKMNSIPVHVHQNKFWGSLSFREAYYNYFKYSLRIKPCFIESEKRQWNWLLIKMYLCKTRWLFAITTFNTIRYFAINFNTIHFDLWQCHHLLRSESGTMI